MNAHGPFETNDQDFYIGESTDTKPIRQVRRGSKFVETNTQKTYLWTGSEEQGEAANWVEQYDAVTLGTRLAHERNPDSTTGTGYASIAEEGAMSAAIDLSNNASTVVYNGPALLLGIWVEVTIGTAAATIDDDTTDRVGVPVALPIGYHDLGGVIFETNLTVNPADSTTGTIRVKYRPLDPNVTWAY